MNRDFALIDANINRAREGLRLIEDACRFVIRNQAMYEKTRAVREKLTSLEQVIGSGSRLSGRAELPDIGPQTVEEASDSQSLWKILHNNFSRSTEALRIVEEFCALYAKRKKQLLEEMRHDLYRLEFETLVLTPHYWLNLYFDAGTVCAVSDKIEELAALVNRGAKVIRLSSTVSSKTMIYNRGKKLCEFIKKYEEKYGEGGRIILLLDNHADVAASLPVAGVYLENFDTPLIAARRRLGSGKIIGVAGSLEIIKKSALEGADFGAIGPVFADDEQLRDSEIRDIHSAGKEMDIPWMVYGRINKDNCKKIYSAGALNLAISESAGEFF